MGRSGFRDFWARLWGRPAEQTDDKVERVTSDAAETADRSADGGDERPDDDYDTSADGSADTDDQEGSARPIGQGTGERETIDTVSPSTSPATSTAPRKRKPASDAILIAAVDIARQAILEVAADGEVGDHIGASMEGDRLVTHSFVCTAKGYRGWYWIAVLTRVPRSKKVTVCETALLPGDDALTAPEWLPWDERLKPGDVGPRDVLPYLDDDPNLEPGYEETNDDDSDRLALYELGLGRERVLSPEGRQSAAERWEAGENGPNSETARNSDMKCSSCGYLMLLAGSLRRQFGVCANAWSPQDGQVVSLDHGCGAHSETRATDSRPEVAPPVVDEMAFDLASSPQ
ncbi:DUF3027 domain-containing protein [Spelaeicoccus albus]|uniref:DUF3027 domain-containing protein n=1 Tax=Spelaeicoccus albus TaxID=1280376 RepID=A0A7Z0A986_9MICO|nr:DUF3027 domain-containing protein [Spelaeicoccus albus]NYI65913.1 hypothetical protein [Spelaeicoccus albus]